MKNLKKTILFLSILFGSMSQVNAQLNGYGGVSSGLTTMTGATYYADDDRAKGTNYTSTNLTESYIDYSNPKGAFVSIAAGDRLLIIQMKGSFIGSHQEVEVITISGSTLHIQSIPTQDMNNYSTASGDQVQLIKLKKYYNLTLTNGAVLTCHTWNESDGSGGVLAIMVSNILRIDNGLITVAGKGFTPEEAGVTWGVGSTGSAPNATANLQNAAVSPPNTACMDGYGTVSVNQGDDGGAAGSAPGLGTTNAGTPVYYGGSYKPTLLVMGDPGYYQSGYGAADGGQGGGWGGQGANSSASCSPNAGTAGVQGIVGWDGGNAGRGGNGGGAMVIKAQLVRVYTTAVVFDASGQAGTPGGNGGYGGAGGIGGNGGPGCCTPLGTAIPQGGFGGFGDTGLGGEGGDGGDGGAAGYIWIGTTSYQGAIPRKRNFGYKVGKGGKAGWGGWSAINTTPHNMSAKNECTGADCASSSTGCAPTVCNPDYAMCLLATTTTEGNLISLTTNDYEFVNGSNPTVLGRYISKNTTGDGDLEMYSTNACSTTTIYRANCVGDCDILFKQIATKENVNTDFTVTVPVSGTGCSPSLSFPFNINFRDQILGNIPLLHYYHDNINTPATLTDVSGGSDNVGTFTSCYSLQGPGDGEEYVNSPYNPVPYQAPQGNGGAAPTPTPDPDPTGAGSATDNVIIDEGDTWFTSGINSTSLSNAFRAIAYPNPADKDLYIELQSETNVTANVTVKDVNGKEIITTKQRLQKGKNIFTLDVAKLKAGFYMVTINANNQQSVLKVTIQ